MKIEITHALADEYRSLRDKHIALLNLYYEGKAQAGQQHKKDWNSFCEVLKKLEALEDSFSRLHRKWFTRRHKASEWTEAKPQEYLEAEEKAIADAEAKANRCPDCGADWRTYACCRYND